MLITNARMYSVSAEAAERWRVLLSTVASRAGLPLALIEHAAPRPIDELWQRSDLGAVFMCGLPYSRAEPRPFMIAAPVPSPPEFAGRPDYWSEFVVRADSTAQSLEDTFGGRLALTVPNSQSGCVAALTHLMTVASPGIDTLRPLYREVIAPTVTPLGALSAVINQAADVAPIDAYALRLLRRYRPELTVQLRVVARTSPTPIPILVSSTPEAEPLRAAFLAAERDAELEPLLAGLLLRGFALPDAAVYDVLEQRSRTATTYWREHPLATVIHPSFSSVFRDPGSVTARLRPP
jgi:ABC-type phosphate/phosphonate transport system substrate-binding protein